MSGNNSSFLKEFAIHRFSLCHRPKLCIPLSQLFKIIFWIFSWCGAAIVCKTACSFENIQGPLRLNPNISSCDSRQKALRFSFLIQNFALPPRSNWPDHIRASPFPSHPVTLTFPQLQYLLFFLHFSASPGSRFQLLCEPCLIRNSTDVSSLWFLYVI